MKYKDDFIIIKKSLQDFEALNEKLYSIQSNTIQPLKYTKDTKELENYLTVKIHLFFIEIGRK